jgi:hypothetical protein
MRKMFLRSALVGETAIPLRIYDLYRRQRLRPTVWARTPKVNLSDYRPHILIDETDRLPDDILNKLCEDRHIDRPMLNPALKEYFDINNRLNTIRLRESPVSHVDAALRLVPYSCKGIGENDSRRKMLVTQPPTPDVVIGRSDTNWGLYEAHNADGVTIGDLLDAEQHFKWSKKGTTVMYSL